MKVIPTTVTLAILTLATSALGETLQPQNLDNNTLLVQQHGDGTRNGGSDVKAKFIFRGQRIVRFANYHTVGRALMRRHGIDAELLGQALTRDNIHVQMQRIFDQQGSKVDAVVDSATSQGKAAPAGVLPITLEEDRWIDLLRENSDIDYLIFHEILNANGHAGKDADHEISGEIRNFEHIIARGRWIPADLLPLVTRWERTFYPPERQRELDEGYITYGIESLPAVPDLRTLTSRVLQHELAAHVPEFSHSVRVLTTSVRAFVPLSRPYWSEPFPSGVNALLGDILDSDRGANFCLALNRANLAGGRLVGDLASVCHESMTHMLHPVDSGHLHAYLVLLAGPEDNATEFRDGIHRRASLYIQSKEDPTSFVRFAMGLDHDI